MRPFYEMGSLKGNGFSAYLQATLLSPLDLATPISCKIIRHFSLRCDVDGIDALCALQFRPWPSPLIASINSFV